MNLRKNHCEGARALTRGRTGSAETATEGARQGCHLEKVITRRNSGPGTWEFVEKDEVRR